MTYCLIKQYRKVCITYNNMFPINGVCYAIHKTYKLHTTIYIYKY